MPFSLKLIMRDILSKMHCKLCGIIFDCAQSQVSYESSNGDNRHFCFEKGLQTYRTSHHESTTFKNMTAEGSGYDLRIEEKGETLLDISSVFVI